jgi:hypothetical protein
VQTFLYLVHTSYRVQTSASCKISKQGFQQNWIHQNLSHVTLDMDFVRRITHYTRLIRSNSTEDILVLDQFHMIDILTGISGKFRYGHLHTQKSFGDFISNWDSAGLTDLNKWKKEKKRNGPSCADLGRSWRTPAHFTRGALEGRISTASIWHRAHPPRRDANTQRETLATPGPSGSSPWAAVCEIWRRCRIDGGFRAVQEIHRSMHASSRSSRMLGRR